MLKYIKHTMYDPLLFTSSKFIPFEPVACNYINTSRCSCCSFVISNYNVSISAQTLIDQIVIDTNNDPILITLTLGNNTVETYTMPNNLLTNYTILYRVNYTILHDTKIMLDQFMSTTLFIAIHNIQEDMASLHNISYKVIDYHDRLSITPSNTPIGTLFVYTIHWPPRFIDMFRFAD